MNSDSHSNEEINQRFNVAGSDDAETVEQNRIAAQESGGFDDTEDFLWWLGPAADEVSACNFGRNSQYDDDMTSIAQETREDQVAGTEIDCQVSRSSETFFGDASRNQTLNRQSNDSANQSQGMNVLDLANQQQPMYMGESMPQIPSAVCFRIPPGVEYLHIPVMLAWPPFDPHMNYHYVPASFNDPNVVFCQSQQFQHPMNWQAASQNIMTNSQINRMTQQPNPEYIQGIPNSVENVLTRTEHVNVSQCPPNRYGYGQQHPAMHNVHEQRHISEEMNNEQINDLHDARVESPV